MKRKDFMEQAKLDKVWNRINTDFQINGAYIATVLWHSNPWKLVTTTNFDDITDRADKSHIQYECYSQADLWKHVKAITE